MLPKTETAAEIELAIRLCGRDIPIIAPIESAAGLAGLPQTLGAHLVPFVAFGSIDFALDVGCVHSRVALFGVRTELVWRSRAVGKLGPLDGVTTRVDSELAAFRDARHAVDLGFSGKLAIHPLQIAPIARAFHPDPSAVDWAERVLAVAGDGNAERVDGEMVDGPVVERAHSLLRRAQSG
ncbi:MAG: HpcH/HpaI aldolase/citrate lyase family protein [Roseiarcus sp.]